MAPRKPPAVTIRAVAERAGVSAMTVSNVVNGVGKAGPSTIAAVRRAVEELGYIPNVAARRLASAHATTIGLLYSDHQTPFLDAILVGTLRATTAQGLQLVVRDGEGHSRGEAETLARTLVAGGADALILIPPFAEFLSGTGFIDTLGVPAAAIATGGAMPDLITVRIDNRTAMRALAELVIARGHRRIGFVAGAPGNTDAQERRAGFEEALDAHAIERDRGLVVQGYYTFDSGVAAARILLDRDPSPTAIIASNDESAAGVIHEASRRGLRLPQQLAVTGFDDTSIAARLWPPLTACRQPIGEMAHRAAELLIETLRQPAAQRAPADEVIDHVIVERMSTSGE